MIRSAAFRAPRRVMENPDAPSAVHTHLSSGLPACPDTLAIFTAQACPTAAPLVTSRTDRNT